MANALTRSLARLFRDRAEYTSLRRLKREGVRRVQVLDVSRLEELVRHAIERVLLESTQSKAEGFRLAKSAHIEFLRMLGERDSLERTTQELRREQRSLEMNLQQVSGALAEARRELNERLEAEGRETLMEYKGRIDATLDDVFGRTLGEFAGEAARIQPALQHLRRPLADALFSLFGQVLQRGQGQSILPIQDGGEVDVLARRVRKLTAALSEANELIHRLEQKKADEEGGVPSIYKEVQGLTGREKDYEQRRELLREVFQLNLELRKEIDSRR